MIMQKTGLVKLPATRTWNKKRRREITPEDELRKRESDEKKFKTEENKALELETKDDGSYEESAGSEES